MPLSDLNLKNKSLSKQIYNALKDQIIKGEFSPGERLVIDRIAKKIGVSSTPVRDALQLLISSGFAEKKSNDGIFIVELSKEDIIELFDMREVLEGLAVRLLTQEINNKKVEIDKLKMLKNEFLEKEEELLTKRTYVPHELDIKLHDLVLDLSPNKRLKKQIKIIMNQTYRIRNIQHQSKTKKALNREKGNRNNRMLRETQEHVNIIEMMLQGNSEKAENMMRKHIRNAKNDILVQVNVPEWKT